MKRFVALLLLASMLLGAVACAESKDTTTETQADDASSEEVTEAESTNEPTLPDYSGEGADFTLLYRYNAGSYNDDFIYYEAATGDVVEDAVYNRNLKTAEKFDLTIVAIESDSVSSKMQMAVSAGDDEYDLCWDQRHTLSGLISGGYLADFTTINYINTNASYWDANAIAEMSLGGRSFLAVNDISLENLNDARFLYFDRQIITDNNLPDPYDYIYSNTWTLDVVLGMIKMISFDLDGDGQMTGADRFGMLREDGSGNGNVIYFVKGCNIPYTVLDSEGYPELAVNTEKTADVITMCNEVLTDDTCTITYEKAASGADTSGYNHLFEYCRAALFTTDHFLFVQAGVGESSSMKDMVSDYGFAPNPKYDSDQESYYIGVDPYGVLMAVASSETDLDRIGIVSEYMAWLSSETVLPAYYDTTIKVKRARDERDAEIMDIIKSSIKYEMSDIFGWGVDSLIWNAFKSGNWASKYEKSEKGIIKKIEATIEEMKTIGE